MLRQQCCEVPRCAVRAIRRKYTLRQRELPQVTLALLNKWCEPRVGLHAYIVGRVIEELPLRRRTLAFRQCLNRIRLRALLHEPHKRLRPMSGMQRDERESVIEHALYHGLGARVVLLLHAAMTPDDECVGGIKRGVAQSLLGIIEPRRLHGKSRLFFQMRSEGFTGKFFTISLLLLGLLLVPYKDADVIRGACGGEGKEDK